MGGGEEGARDDGPALGADAVVGELDGLEGEAFGEEGDDGLDGADA